MSFKKQEVFTNHEHLSSPRVLLGFVLLVILVFCVVLLFYLSSFYVLLHVSLDCLFLFVVLSNVYHPVALQHPPTPVKPHFHHFQVLVRTQLISRCLTCMLPSFYRLFPTSPNDTCEKVLSTWKSHE